MLAKNSKNVRRAGYRRGIRDHADGAGPMHSGLLGDGAQAVHALGAPGLALAGKIDLRHRQAPGLGRGCRAIDEVGGWVQRGKGRANRRRERHTDECSSRQHREQPHRMVAGALAQCQLRAAVIALSGLELVVVAGGVGFGKHHRSLSSIFFF
ncbi:hypothetical protein MESS2_1480053 [Mesorhizobium metallidurans STM 2683]|uniref:Uncharacterized protein n=1 Tax=Mesorhizobium metallidurans STM 2683 TaxID=1297569 RepID=M5EKZ6_9HYPH|nr:hypothetical protein MESS2_1480053 [Mesorhizobium metallidurans STM 2683]